MTRPRPSPLRGVSVWRASQRVCAAAGLLVAVGCGHPATRAECEEIFQRSAAIELRSRDITDPDEVTRRTAEARADRGDALLEECVGTRITEAALTCVRDAQTVEDFEACLR